MVYKRSKKTTSAKSRRKAKTTPKAELKVELKEEPEVESKVEFKAELKEEPKEEKVEPVKEKLETLTVVKEVVDAPTVKEKLPVATMVAVDPLSRVSVMALHTGSRFIGGQRYHMETGKEVEGGILLAHLDMLERAGVVKKA